MRQGAHDDHDTLTRLVVEVENLQTAMDALTGPDGPIAKMQDQLSTLNRQLGKAAGIGAAALVVIPILVTLVLRAIGKG